jgi:hypothetical protein
MDVKAFISAQGQLPLGKPAATRLNLTVGQNIDAKVISAGISEEKSAVLLKVVDRHLELQSSQPIKLMPGQALKLQVIQLSPVVAFTILPQLPNLKTQNAVLSLQFVQPADEKRTTVNNSEAPLALKQRLEVKITGLTAHQIQLQVVSPPNTRHSQASVLTLDRTQLQLPDTAMPATPFTADPAIAAPALKIGQQLTLEVVRTGIHPEFKLLPALPVIEEKISDWIKQVLPRHEASPVVLNQLEQDLPRLLSSGAISQTLKQMAAAFLQTLPGRPQLTDQQGLKHAVSQSGLFFEARLQQSAEQPASVFKDDFKARLLKFVQALKQETQKNAGETLDDAELGLLKNLERKSGNALAKIVLDQLASLPRDDSPKQVWTLEIPFMENAKADTIKMAIKRDKKNNTKANDGNWSVNVTVTPPGLGTVACTVSLLDDGLHAYFLGQEPQTADLIDQHLDYFREQLERSGLKTGRIVARSGQAKTEPAPEEIAGKPLFDDRA